MPSCSSALRVTTTSNGCPPPWPQVGASARSGCGAPSATSTPPPGRSSATWTPRICRTRRSTSRAGTGAPRSARPAPRPTAPTPTSSSEPGWQAARACPSRSPSTRACSPPSPPPPSAPSTPASPPTAGRVARCRPRRKANYCPHGRRLSCGQRHKEDRRLPGQAAVPRLLRLQRCRRVERPRPRAVAAHRHRPPPPPGQARQDPRHPGQAVLRQGRRVPAPRADPLPRHLPPRRPRPPPPRTDPPAPSGVHRRRAGRCHPAGRAA